MAALARRWLQVGSGVIRGTERALRGNAWLRPSRHVRRHHLRARPRLLRPLPQGAAHSRRVGTAAPRLNRAPPATTTASAPARAPIPHRSPPTRTPAPLQHRLRTHSPRSLGRAHPHRPSPGRRTLPDRRPRAPRPGVRSQSPRSPSLRPSCRTAATVRRASHGRTRHRHPQPRPRPPHPRRHLGRRPRGRAHRRSTRSPRLRHGRRRPRS